MTIRRKESIKWNDFEVVIDGDETTEDDPYSIHKAITDCSEC